MSLALDEGQEKKYKFVSPPVTRRAPEKNLRQDVGRSDAAIRSQGKEITPDEGGFRGKESNIGTRDDRF